MQFRTPIQLILPGTYDESKAKKQKRAGTPRPLQDEATRAWNFFSALYYKAGGTPWRLQRDPYSLDACFVGISFFETLDRSRLTTSMAQVFNELGEGVVVRGGAAALSKEDRQPHLGKVDCEELLRNALARYREVHKNLPARVVVHKVLHSQQRSRRERGRQFSGRELRFTIFSTSPVPISGCTAMAYIAAAGDIPANELKEILPLQGAASHFSRPIRAFMFAPHRGHQCCW